MSLAKKSLGEKKYKKNEDLCNVGASFLAGSVAAAITNPLECITVNK